jgi:cytidylate kinase
VFRIITIEREYGCGGGGIAQQLAGKLGWKLWDQSVTDEIAKLANVDPATVKRCDERVDGALHRVAKVFWRGSYEPSMLLPNAVHFDTDRMVNMVQQVVENAASEGNCVIVGRGAPYFLRDRLDVFHVFLYAPRAEKLRRTVQLGRSREEAESLINSIDRDRIAFIKHYFNADWPTRALYHMMINTVVGDDQVVSTILETMRSLDQKSRTELKST